MSATMEQQQQEENWWSRWSEAHVRTCRAKNTLFATPLQVLEFTKANANASSSSSNASLIYWSLPVRQEVTAWKYSRTGNNNGEMLDAFVKTWKGDHHAGSNNNGTTTPTQDHSMARTPASPSSSGGLFHYMTSTVAATFSPLVGALTPGRRPCRPPPPPQMMMMGHEQDDALRSWNDDEAEEDAGLAVPSANSTSTSGCAFDNSNRHLIAWDLPVLNVDMTETCLAFLEQALSSQVTSGIFPKVISRRRTTASTTTTTTATSISGEKSVDCWNGWIKSNCHSSHQLTRLSDVEADFLLDCLSRSGTLTLIPADEAAGMPKQDLVVLAPQLVEGDGSNKNSISMHQQVLAAWWELNTAQTNLEARRRQWSKEADGWAKRALQEKAKAKQQNREKGAGLVSFKIHKLFVKRLEQSEGVLFNLEQSRQALEESWHQRQVVQALETSTKALQNLRQDSQQDNIEDLMDAYRNEVDYVEDTQQALSAPLSNMEAVDAAGHRYDEDDLLKELERLTLQDDIRDTSSEQPPTKQVVDAGVIRPEKVEMQAVSKPTEPTLSTEEPPRDTARPPEATEKVLLPE